MHHESTQGIVYPIAWEKSGENETVIIQDLVLTALPNQHVDG